MPPHSRLIGFFCALSITLACVTGSVADEPVRAAQNPDAQQALASMRVPDGFEVDVWATEPMLENAVAIEIDEHGRMYVVETHRLHRGVSDNRASAFWLDDDLAAMHVDDRLEYQRKWADNGEREWNWYTDYDERVRLLIDEDGDGKADVSHMFAEGFDDPLHGLASGVLAYRDNVYFTNIPDLYLLRDTTGDHHADQQQSLHHGYGVRTAFLGHDLHGLIHGPDGKLYFSVGDRGYNIETEDGRTIVDPKDPGRGAVFRCNLDGSELEIVYYGLRNPQELAFDKYGNLFTVDNDADGRDRARVVYILEGGDTGWSMTYQYMEDRGPWERERLWETENDDQPAWALPPLYHLSAGPSGLEYNPGVAGLPSRYDDYFFLVDFRGSPANSGIHAFSLEQNGAAFAMADPHEFIWSILAVDLRFGYDGRLYFTDWDNGWGIQDPPVGRIHVAWHEDHVDDPAIAELGEIIREDFTTLADDKLAALLAHDDMRVRLRAQYALAERIDDASGAAVLRSAAESARSVPARLHAIWAMGQVLREGHTFIIDDLLAHLDDDDYNVRAQAAKTLGDAAGDLSHGRSVRAAIREGDAVDQLIDRLNDDSAHVRALTAIALGKIGDEAAFEPLMQLLHDNADADRHLRHAAVMGIHGTSDADALVERASTASAAQRLGIVLALRRHEDARLAQFLHDQEEHIVYEAASAIYDLNIAQAMPALAALLEQYTQQGSQAADDTLTFERRFYRNIAGGSLADLRSADKFPDDPDEIDHTTAFSIPVDQDGNYGTLVRGRIVAPESGEYRFMIAADDVAELYLSSSDSPDDKRLIASVPSWTAAHEYDKHAEQLSEPITLEAGQTYYIEAIHKEGEGGDHLMVAWRLPDGTVEQPIGAADVDTSVELVRRLINANLALGDFEHAQRVAHFAADASQPAALRREALSVLQQWTAEPLRDRVNNYHRPLEQRDPQIVRDALEPVIVTIVDHSAGRIQSQATELATELGLALDEETLLARLSDPGQSVDARVAVLRSLIGSNSPRAREAIAKALESQQPLLRAEGRRLLAERDAAAGLGALRQALENGEQVEQQLAFRALGALNHDGADEMLVDWLEELVAGSVRQELQLDLVEGARQRNGSAVREALAEYDASLPADDQLAPYRVALRGGDADAGRNIFFSHPTAQCIRCHSIDGVGGDAAPDLTGVGSRRSRANLLEDIVAPNAEVAEGFGTVVVTLSDNQVIAGTLREETDQQLTIVTGDGQVRQIAADDVASRSPAISAMPPMAHVLTPRELRDVIEYLATHEEE